MRSSDGHAMPSKKATTGRRHCRQREIERGVGALVDTTKLRCFARRRAAALSFWEALRIWFQIGVLSFGGPTAQIALMHRVIVDERKWLTEQQFLNALGFCMLLPGPEAMQLATYSGWRLHGVRGGIAAGLLFVLPGALIVLVARDDLCGVRQSRDRRRAVLRHQGGRARHRDRGVDPDRQACAQTGRALADRPGFVRCDLLSGAAVSSHRVACRAVGFPAPGSK